MTLVPKLRLGNAYPRSGVAPVRLEAHLETLKKCPEDDRLLNGAMREAERLRATVAKCRRVLLKVSYGFPHAHANISVGEYLLPEPLEADDPHIVYRQTEEFQTSLLDLRQRMFGRLMQIAEL